MKFFSRKVGIVAALALAIAIGVAWYFATAPGPVGSGHSTEETVELLEHQTVNLNFREAPLTETIEFMNRHLAERPALAHLHVALWKEGVPPGWVYIEGAPTSSANDSSVDLSEFKISIELTNCPFLESLRYLCNLGGYRYAICGETIYCVQEKEHGSMGEMVERTLRYHPSSTIIGSTDPVKVKNHLRDTGQMTFYVGSEVRVVDRNRVLIRNLQSELAATPQEFEPTLRERVDGWTIIAKEKLDSLLGRGPGPIPSLPPPSSLTPLPP